MATAPVKSRPLHNFSLPFLKWSGKNNTNTVHRFRRPNSEECFPAVDTSELEYDGEGSPNVCVGSRTSRNRLAFASCSMTEKSVKHLEREDENEGDEVKEVKGEDEKAESEGMTQKPWNLRPRRGLFLKSPVGLKNGGELQETDAAVQSGENQLPKSLRLRGFAESPSMEKKEKRKLWIALSREEIEEDIFIMTGSRPSRRSKKRNKNVQKQLDNVFPGLWLVGSTADSYRVPDTTAKR